MEDDAKEDRTLLNKPKFQPWKAGWLRKAPCRLLATYKERYIQVEKTEMVVYDNENLQNCTERLDLENYDRCQELKSGFKKKHRLILIRSPKSGNKVCNIKFQTHSAEEKEAWIKAFSDGINKAKNKVLDEVMVDESSNLEHVTRSRPKANRSRRPPTRIHRKEVAVVSSDGILRLDLDLKDAYMPNGTNQADADLIGTNIDNLVSWSQTDSGEKMEIEMVTKAQEPEEPRVTPQIKVIPMPPTKKPIPSSEPQAEPEDSEPEKQVLNPPLPPAKEAKPQTPPGPDQPEGPEVSVRTNTCSPPLPANKRCSRSSMIDPTQSHSLNPSESQSSEAAQCHSKDQLINESIGNKGTTMERDEADQPSSESSSTDAEGWNIESGETVGEGVEAKSDIDADLPPEPVRESQGLPSTSRKTAEIVDSTGSFQAEQGPTAGEVSASPSHSSGKNEERKSTTSDGCSDHQGEGAGCENILEVSTAVVQEGSNPPCLLVFSNEDHPSASPLKPSFKTKLEVPLYPSTKPIVPLKPSAKARSVSIGDLLSNTKDYHQVTQQRKANSIKIRDGPDGVRQLESEVSVEMKKTSELLRRVSQANGEKRPEELLAEAMEKLRVADYVLRKVNTLQLTNRSPSRKSW